MPDHVYAVTEIVGSSSKSIDDAIRNAVRIAAQTLRNLHWFEVVETRGMIDGTEVGYFQVTVKIGFRHEDKG